MRLLVLVACVLAVATGVPTIIPTTLYVVNDEKTNNTSKLGQGYTVDDEKSNYTSKLNQDYIVENEKTNPTSKFDQDHIVIYEENTNQTSKLDQEYTVENEKTNHTSKFDQDIKACTKKLNIPSFVEKMSVSLLNCIYETNSLIDEHGLINLHKFFNYFTYILSDDEMDEVIFCFSQVENLIKLKYVSSIIRRNMNIQCLLYL
ncbi:uncharacterized protein [Anoplolepis gracilipes]|uniref:uncharacterized protein n=1 Tax=Anoplolepis gracilipes TaxID=354296 RepID=UPI003B9E1980